MELRRERHAKLQDEQGDGDGHYAIRQGEQALHAGQVFAGRCGGGIGGHRHLASQITGSRPATPAQAAGRAWSATMVLPDGNTIDWTGEFLEVVPDRRLVLTMTDRPASPAASM